jgi:hypothetical protein
MYTTIVEAFLFDMSGMPTGRQRLRQAIEVGDQGKTFAGTVSAEILDTQGNTVFTGCATITGQRME